MVIYCIVAIEPSSSKPSSQKIHIFDELLALALESPNMLLYVSILEGFGKVLLMKCMSNDFLYASPLVSVI